MKFKNCLLYYIRPIRFQNGKCQMKYHTEIMSDIFASDQPKSIVEKGGSFLIGRLRVTESISFDYVLVYKKYFIGFKRIDRIRQLAFSNTGVLTNNLKDFYRFVDIYIDSTRNLDIGFKWIVPMGAQ